MEIRRDSIYIGEVFKQDFFSLQCLRKILFTLDKNNNKGIDLMNIGISYPFNINNNKINIAQTFSLDENLQKLGYPEILTEEDINKLINADFYEVIINSGIYQQLQDILRENTFDEEIYQNDINFSHAEFMIHDEENNVKPKSIVKKIFRKRGI